VQIRLNPTSCQYMLHLSALFVFISSIAGMERRYIVFGAVTFISILVFIRLSFLIRSLSLVVMSYFALVIGGGLFIWRFFDSLLGYRMKEYYIYFLFLYLFVSGLGLYIAISKTRSQFERGHS